MEDTLDTQAETTDAELARKASLVLDPQISLLGRSIHELDKRVCRSIDSALVDASSVSQTQALAIIYIWRHEDHEPVYQYMLERQFHLSTPTLTASLKSLVSRGFITRTRDPDDGRYYRLNLTENGRDIVPACIDAFTQVDEKLACRLSDEERQTFVALTNKLLSRDES